MAVANSPENRARANFDGRGLDLMTEFRKLPKEIRESADKNAAILAMVPTAVHLALRWLKDSHASALYAHLVSTLCAQLSEDEWGDQALWRTLAELFEFCANSPPNGHPIFDRLKEFVGNDERACAIRLIGCMLATNFETTEQALHSQLAYVEIMLNWHPPESQVYELVILPYFEEFWRNASLESRFLFRAPDLTVAAIDSALGAPRAL